MLDVEALLAAARDPFPGLRAFQIDEGLKFFGRDAQIHEVLQRLSTDRFVAVVGSSGCGKSSLVRAGVIPALERGHLNHTSSRWRVAVMRPGAAPLEQLAECLARDASITLSEALRDELHATSAGLVDVISHAGLSRQESVLIVVDQFEELFTFGKGRTDQEAEQTALFVSQLLYATEQSRIPVYVVITMRSDFLGDCAKFTGLAEALTRSQYLVPRMTREQRRECIVRPLSLVNATASPALVQRLLNDAGDDGDDLPVLQHVLARTYERWLRTSKGELTIDDYLAVGAVENAIAEHGKEIMNQSLGEEERATAERIFRALTVTDDGRATRRPTRLEALYLIVGAEPADRSRVDRVIGVFAERKQAFLTLSTPTLRPDTIVDITHESLIRKWPTLTAWAKDEARSAEWYRDLCRDVVRHAEDQAGLWHDPDLSSLMERSRRESWNEDWARQYNPGDEPSFSAANAFLERSVAAREEERRVKAAQVRRERRLKQGLVGAVGLLLLFTTIAGGWLYLRSEGSRQQTNEDLSTAVDASQTVSQTEARTSVLEAQIADLQARLAAQPSGTDPGRAATLQQLQGLTNDLKKEKDAYAEAQATLDRLRKERAAEQSDSAAIVARVETLQRQLGDANRQNAVLENELALARKAAPGPSQTPIQSPPPPTTQVPASAYATEEPEIRGVMNAYADAYNKKDVTLLTKVFPSLPKPQDLQKVLNEMTTMSVSLSDLQIVLLPSLTSARVNATFKESFDSKSFGRRSSDTAREWYLQKQGGQWFVAAVR